MGLLDLFRQAHRSKKPDVRLEAVGRIQDQPLLAELAKTDSSARVREAAVARIDDQRLLMSVALDGDHIDARIAAVERLESQEDLAEIVKARKNLTLMGACFAKITDRDILERIAADRTQSITARRMAVENFADESYLAEIAPAPSEGEAAKSPEEIDALIDRYGAARLVRVFGKFRGSRNAILGLGEVVRRGGDAGLTAIDYLAMGLRHANPEIRKCATDQLASLSGAEQVSYLIRLMDNAQLHPRILEVLARIDHPEARRIIERQS